MTFLDAVAVFAMIAATYYGCMVIVQTENLPHTQRFYATPMAGRAVRICIVVIIISSLWLLFGESQCPA